MLCMISCFLWMTRSTVFWSIATSDDSHVCCFYLLLFVEKWSKKASCKYNLSYHRQYIDSKMLFWSDFFGNPYVFNIAVSILVQLTFLEWRLTGIFVRNVDDTPFRDHFSSLFLTLFLAVLYAFHFSRFNYARYQYCSIGFPQLHLYTRPADKGDKKSGHKFD